MTGLIMGIVLGLAFGFGLGFALGFFMAGWCYRRGIRDAFLVSGVRSPKSLLRDTLDVLSAEEGPKVYPVDPDKPFGMIL